MLDDSSQLSIFERMGMDIKDWTIETFETYLSKVRKKNHELVKETGFKYFILVVGLGFSSVYYFFSSHLF